MTEWRMYIQLCLVAVLAGAVCILLVPITIRMMTTRYLYVSIDDVPRTNAASVFGTSSIDTYKYLVVIIRIVIGTSRMHTAPASTATRQSCMYILHSVMEQLYQNAPDGGVLLTRQKKVSRLP